MLEIKVWLALALVLEIPAIAMTVSRFSFRKSGLGWDYTVGISMLTFGLTVQIARSMNYIKFGAYPEDHYFPWWLFKDFGASVLLFCFVRDSGRWKKNQTSGIEK